MNPEELQRITNVLRSQRERLGLSAAEVSRRANIEVSTVTRLELGQVASPRLSTLRAIADALEISDAEIFALGSRIKRQSYRPSRHICARSIKISMSKTLLRSMICDADCKLDMARPDRSVEKMNKTTKGKEVHA